MKHIKITAHSETCKGFDFGDIRYSCSNFPKEVVVLLGNEYLLIEHNCCISYGNDAELIETLIKSGLAGKYKSEQIKEVRRSINLNDFIENIQQGNYLGSKYTHQIHYIYADNAGKEYAIISRVEMIEEILKEEERNKNFEKAKNFLLKNQKHKFIEKLIKIHEANAIGIIKEKVFIKSIDAAVKYINKEIINK